MDARTWFAVAQALQTEAVRKADKRTKDSIRGHVCGYDMGQDWRTDKGDPNKRQPRNAPCACGSGLKAKNCCVTYGQAQITMRERVNADSEV